MSVSKIKRRAIILSLSVLPLAVALMLTFTMLPPEQQIISTAHASSSDPVSGCASCHTKPIVADCTECHATPPTLIDDDIAFPHHDPAEGGPPDNCQSGNCHSGMGNDARYVETLEASMNYCGQCHQYEHSSP